MWMGFWVTFGFVGMLLVPTDFYIHDINTKYNTIYNFLLYFQSIDGMHLVDLAFGDNEKKFRDAFKKMHGSWRNFRYELKNFKLSIKSKNMDFSLELSFLHLIVFSKNLNFLKFMFDKENCIDQNEWLEPVKVRAMGKYEN